jgi:AraC-like DNA-binding protein
VSGTAVLYFCDKRSAVPVSKGHLNPGSPDVAFDRFELGPGLAELVRHVWVVRWAIPAGQVRAQRVLTYPAFNAVFDAGSARLFGPSSSVQVQELAGTSWAVGVLFRPAAARVLSGTEPALVPASGERVQGAPVQAVAALMNESPPASGARLALVGLLRAWLLPCMSRLDHRATLVNTVCELAENDNGILRSSDLAERVNVPLRSLERLVYSHLGVSPKWLIECRRLQHAATVLFAEPSTSLTGLAASLGYTDYPHFSRSYKSVIGETPRATRELGEAQRRDA